MDLGPVDESTQTELTSSGIKDIKDYAQYYRDSIWSNYNQGGGGGGGGLGE